jgi:hypothetical protein
MRLQGSPGNRVGPLFFDSLNRLLLSKIISNRHHVRHEALESGRRHHHHGQEPGHRHAPVGSYGNVIRILKPLVFADAQLEKGLGIPEEGQPTLKI